MNAGQLKHRITIRQPASGQDGAGQPNVGWTTLATVWADVRYSSGLESIKADAQTGLAKASIRIRWRTDVTSAMQVVLGVTTFSILAVLPDMKARKYVDLACQVVQ